MLHDGDTSNILEVEACCKNENVDKLFVKSLIEGCATRSLCIRYVKTIIDGAYKHLANAKSISMYSPKRYNLSIRFFIVLTSSAL